MTRKTDTSGLQGSLDQTAGTLDSFARGPASDAAGLIGDAFARAGSRISGALETAARTGELSVARLARSILRDLSAIAIERHVTAPLTQALGSILKLPVSGARASGGPVTAGGAYLVGERGPELFVPGQGGQIETGLGTGPVQVTINMAPGASLPEARRSAAQVAAALARAVQRGGRLA